MDVNYPVYSDGEIQWLQFQLLTAETGITHAVFLREGGCSKGSFSSLNAGYSRGDDPGDVTDNLFIISKVMNAHHGSRLDRIIKAKINHNALVADVDKNTHPIPHVDALVSSHHHLGLMITHADCQCAIFFDPILKVVANVHCGWRGNVQNIYRETIQHLKAKHGCKPENLIVCIGPSLGPESSQFIHYKKELPEPFWVFETKPLYFDLWAISEMQLKKEGILPHHIEIMRIDTFQDKRFFSYRRDKITGCNATVAALR